MLPSTHVQVAAVVISCKGRILAVHNARWGSFAMPMTKRRRWQDPEALSGIREEEWTIAATRAVAAVFGRTLTKEELPKSLSQVRQYKQSDIDGIWKLYDFEGRMDTPLTKTGLAQARIAARWIAAHYAPHKIVSSPLKRALATAEEVARQVRLSVERDAGLLERNNGELAGPTEAAAKAKGLLRLAGYLPHETVPGGESLIEFRARAESFWSKLLKESKTGQRILIVSHGQMIGMLFRCFLKLPMEEDVQLATGDTGIHCWRVEANVRKIVFANSRTHLESPKSIV